jgi:protein-arginine kinase activator protein McsA
MFLSTRVTTNDQCGECKRRPAAIMIIENQKYGMNGVTPLCAQCALNLSEGISRALREAGTGL